MIHEMLLEQNDICQKIASFSKGTKMKTRLIFNDTDESNTSKCNREWSYTLCQEDNTWQKLKQHVLDLYELSYYFFVTKIEYTNHNQSINCIDSQHSWNDIRATFIEQNRFKIYVEQIPPIERIDNALSRYYKQYNQEKEYNQVFSSWMNENGVEYGTDPGEFQYELLDQEEESMCTEWVDDIKNFPFQDEEYKGNNKSDEERERFILELVRKCYFNPDIQFHIKPQATIECAPRLWELDPMEEAERLLKIFCKHIFKSQHQNNAEDKSYLKIKALDMITGRPVLLHFMDSYTRLRMTEYFNQESKRQNKKRQNKEKTDNEIECWCFEQFCDDYKVGIEECIKSSQFRIDGKLITVAELKNGLRSFKKRIGGKMKLYEPVTVVCDILDDYHKYAQSITSYVAKYAAPMLEQDENKDGDEEGDKGGDKTKEMQVPVQIDVLLIPQCTKSLKSNNIPQDFYDNNSDDDDDDEATEVTNNDDSSNNQWMGLEGEANLKSHNHCCKEIGDIGEYLKECGYQKNKDFIVETLERHLEPGIIEQIFLDMHKQIGGARSERVVFIVDRRDPETLTNNEQKYPEYKLKNKNWPDQIYCIKMKKEHGGMMPAQFVRLPESLFDLSHCILPPQLPNIRNRIIKPIGINDSLNGYMFVLSYHVYNHDTVRAYFSYCGSTQRFELQDVEKFWSSIFVKIDGDIKQNIRKQPNCHGKMQGLRDNEFHTFMNHLIDKNMGEM